MDNTTNQISIENKIYELRGIAIMLDQDLAALFQVETKILNKSVKRNSERFPTHFMFQLTNEEWNNLRFQIGTSSETYGGRRFLPYAFTEQGIYFEGQIFDAYLFVSNLVRSAKRSIILFDNYVDDSILTLLDKRENTVKATIYTQKIDKKLQLDIQKHNSQYPPIEIKIIKTIHDRFLLIDNNEVYHFGASLKDLGKKWFAFSRLNDFASAILNRIKE
jgi:hypothetical protein